MKTMRNSLRIFLFLHILTILLFAQMGVPTLNTPQDGTQYYFIEPAYFDWSLIDSAQFYEITVSAQQDFSSSVYNEIVATTSSETNNLFHNWQFYWKVRAGKDSSGFQVFGDWSSVFSFTSEYIPPSNQSPQDEDIDVDYNLVQFTWDMNLDPVVETGNNTYRFQLATDTEFTNIVSEQEISTDKTTQVAALQPATTYYWRVKHTNDYGQSDWSQVTSFQTKNAELSQVVLLEPEDNITGLNPLDVRFTWQEVSGADGYTFELAEDSSFANLLESTSLNGITYTTNITVYEKKLYWRVRAQGGSGEGPWSDVWRLTCAKIAPQSSPTLIAPLNNAVELPTDSIRFEWNPLNEADEYTLQISVNSDFSKLFYINDSLKKTSVTIKGFAEETTYYWRVLGSNTAGEGPWSGVWLFSTKKNTAIEEEIGIARSLYLAQNYPNPFNPVTTIRFQLPEQSFVTLEIYNITGQKVRTLEQSILNRGLHEVVWNARNASDVEVPSGQYFYILSVKNIATGETRRIVKKMLLTR